MPPVMALGTNKLASAFGSLTSANRFIRSGKVDLNIVLKLFPLSFIAAIIGAYLAVFLLFGFDFLSAAGNAKVLNFASNLGALLLFIFFDHVDYVYGLIMAISMIAGSYCGAWFAIKKRCRLCQSLIYCYYTRLNLKKYI